MNAKIKQWAGRLPSSWAFQQSIALLEAVILIALFIVARRAYGFNGFALALFLVLCVENARLIISARRALRHAYARIAQLEARDAVEKEGRQNEDIAP